MDKQVIAIGGGGFGRNPGDGYIEQYILDQTGKTEPNICFIPTATGDNDAYKVNYYSTFSKLSCNPVHLDFFHRTPDLEKLIPEQDAIFVGGGNTKSMLAVWRDWGLDKLLQTAYDKGTVMSGVSAGAICWFTSGITDSWENELKILPCLDIIKASCCPHYDEEPSRIPYVEKILLEERITSCICIEGGSAIHFIDGKPFKNISFKNNKNTYNVFVDNKRIVESPFEKIQL